ncbi:UNVERIFIED_CONTAM: hypothetical protein H355_005524 [Colinus virginianus]|nr:hypothetical protein H355_005524 [Colinus virginianus]
MKFGAKLRAYAVPAWQAAYVRYDALKALISRYEAELQAARKQEEQEVERQHLQELQRFDVTPSSGGYPLQRLLPQATQARSSDAVDSSALLHAVNAEGATSSVNVPGTKERIARGPAGDVGNGEIVQRVRRKAVEEFDVVLAGEVVKVERHFWKELRAVEDRLRAVEEELYLLIPQRRVRELQVSSRCRGQESELHSRPDSSFISRSPLRHSGSAGGLAFRSEPVSKRRHLKRSSRERLGGPAPCAVREGSTSFTCPGEHASGEGYSSSDDGGEVGTAPSTAKALSATESIGLLHTARGHLHNRHDRSRNSGRATKGANATQKGEATSPVKAVSHSAQEDVDNTEANGARIRGLHASTRTAQESSESKGLDVEDVHFVADSEDEGTVHGHRTASRSAELAVEAPGDSCRSGDFDAKWGDYGPSLLSSNRHPSSNSSGEPREESSAVRRVFPQPDVDDDFLSSGGEGAIHAVEREAHVAHLRRLQRVIILILDSFEKLQGFANLNLICVYKILKKRDKKLGTQLLRESFTYYESRLNALVIPRTLKASAVASRSRPLYFALGCLLVLFVNVLILASRKPSNPNFREETLIAYLPIYRFMFECSFATMACAISMACMEAYGVNYKFLLDIDPKSQVDSTTIFGLATLQQLLFFFVFALFLLDYKFAVFGTHDLYWLYMPVLVVLELLLLTLPHPTFRLTYRKHIVSTVVRVFRAGAAGRSMYPPWTYQSIAVGNLIGRLTWATTLMPMSFSSKYPGHSVASQPVSHVLRKLREVRGIERSVGTMNYSKSTSTHGTASLFDELEEAAPDPVLGIEAAYAKSTAKEKVNLGVGAYRTEEGKPYVFRCVRKVEAQLAADTSLSKEYLPIDGIQELKRVAYMSNPTWANHPNIFKKAGFEVVTHPYWDPATRGVDFDGMMKTLEGAAPRSVLVLHTCAHNPTGVDLNESQWRQLLKLCQTRRLIPILDTAYQGYASGDLKRDRFSVELFCNEGCMEMFVCQSFAKNMGLYGERAGMLHIVSARRMWQRSVEHSGGWVCASAERAGVVLSQVKKVIRPMYSSPPLHGGLIACRLLTDPSLRAEWEEELKQVSGRVQHVRSALRSALEKKGTPGTWKHITDQIGMFSYTGLTPDQCDRLTNHWHIFLMRNGRISLAGLNKSNVDYVASAIDEVVRVLPSTTSRI